MLSVEPVLNVLMIWINIIQDCIRVNLMTSREDNNLEMLVGLFEAFHYVRANVDTSVDCLLVWKINLQNDIRILSLNIVNAVNQSFIHVKYDEFLLTFLSWRWKVNDQILHFLWFDDSDIVLYKLQSLHSLHEMLLVEILLLTWLCFLILLRNFGHEGIQSIVCVAWSVIVHQHWVPFSRLDPYFSIIFFINLVEAILIIILERVYILFVMTATINFDWLSFKFLLFLGFVIMYAKILIIFNFLRLCIRTLCITTVLRHQLQRLSSAFNILIQIFPLFQFIFINVVDERCWLGIACLSNKSLNRLLLIILCLCIIIYFTHILHRLGNMRIRHIRWQPI